jgi:hypothetical protein
MQQKKGEEFNSLWGNLQGAVHSMWYQGPVSIIM